MKQSYKFTVLFTLLVSLVFTLVLAVTNTAVKSRINENALLAEQRALLDAFGLESTGDAEAIKTRFTENIEAAQVDEMEYYIQKNASGDVEAYAIPFTGSGLWGTIRGWLGVNPSLDEVKGIVFTEQNETPGLGGRIDEEWFKEQFRGLDISADGDIKYGTVADSNIDAISGATQTSNAVMNILNKLKNETLVELEGKLNG